MAQQDIVTTTGATPPGAAGPSFPPFESESFAGQLIWFAITFGALYVLMAKVALPRIGAILHDRATKLAADLDEAQRLKTESEEASTAYELSLADARAKAKAVAQQKRDALGADTEAKRKALDAELAEKIAASEAVIRDATAQAMSNVRGIAADTASAIVERLTGRAPDRRAVEAAIDSTKAGFDSTKAA